MSLDPAAVAAELMTAYATGATIASPPSARDASFDVAAGFAVEAELVKAARAKGRRPVGRKVGFANKAMWRVLKLETLVWGTMYNDTVTYASNGEAALALGHGYSPKIEPEIVFKLKSPLEGTADPAAALAAVEWIAPGFEIIDCPFADWKFQPADFVAAFGLHAALVVGTPVAITPGLVATLVEALPVFTLRLFKNGDLVEEGSGKNVLRSPALCLGELAGATARQPHSTPLGAGEVITTGALTAAQPIARGQVWRAEVHGLDLAPLTLTLQ